MDGTWKTGFYYGSIKDGFTGLAPYGPSVDAKTKALIPRSGKADDRRASSTSSPGPLYDQSGSCASRRASA